MRNVRAGTRLLASIVLPVLAVQAAAQSKDPPSPADLSRSAIEAHLRTADSAWIASRILDEQRKVRSSAAAAPQADALATVVFKRGLSEDALIAFIAAQQLELARIELKVAVSQDPPVFTISIGGMDLLRGPGDFRDRLRRAVDRIRAEFATMADATQDEESGRFREVALSHSLDAYTVEAIAQRQSIAALLEHPNVAAVFLDEGDARVKDFRAMQELFSPRPSAPASTSPNPR